MDKPEIVSVSGGIVEARLLFNYVPFLPLTRVQARVGVFNAATGQNEAVGGGLLPPNTVDLTYLLGTWGANPYRAFVRLGNGTSAANPIPRAGRWQLKVQLVRSNGTESGWSELSDPINVGAPYRVGVPFVVLGETAGELRVSVNTTVLGDGAPPTNPPSVSVYYVIVYTPCTTKTNGRCFVKLKTKEVVRPDANGTLVEQPVVIIFGLPPGQYFAVVHPLQNGVVGPESPPTDLITVPTVKRTGRKMVAEDAPPGWPSNTGQPGVQSHSDALHHLPDRRLHNRHDLG